MGAVRRAYEERGLVGPYSLARPIALDRLDRAAITDDDDIDAVLSPHLRSPSFLAICQDPAIVNVVAEVLGVTSLHVWATSLFRKEPGERPFHPHQDAVSWHLTPMRATTAWVALEDATEENGALQVALGSHRDALPRIPLPGGVSSKTIDPEQLARFDVTTLPVRAGWFVVFHPLLVHGSAVNRTDHARWALAIRYAARDVVVDWAGFSMFTGKPELQQLVPIEAGG